MNVQINISGKFEKEILHEMLGVIAYNLPEWEKEYKSDKWSWVIKKVKSTFFVKVNMTRKCNGKTIYIKVKELLDV